MIDLYNADPNTRLIAAGGCERAIDSGKPIHACFQFFEREYFLDNRMSFVPGQYDVGRKNYFDVIGRGHNVGRVFAGAKFYPNAYGDEYYINGQPTLYHHWYSSRMARVPADGKVDNYLKSDYEANRNHIFSMDQVRRILE